MLLHFICTAFLVFVYSICQYHSHVKI